MNYRKTIQVVAFLLFFAGTSTSVFAASATISASPSSAIKLVNQEFDISIRVSGSTNFSSFKGSVSLTNLTIVKFTMNASNVIWMAQPSAGSLSFNAAIKGTSGVSSTGVYTIRVKAPSAGTARISLSGGRVVGTNPVEDLGVGYTNGTYNISVPAPVATSKPKATSTAAPVQTLVPTTVSTATLVPTQVVAPTIEATKAYIQVLNLENIPLVDSQVYIDGTPYITDNNGSIPLTGLSSGSHEIKYTFNGTEYKQTFVLGIFTEGRDAVIQILSAQTNKTNTNSILGYALIIGGVLVIINVIGLFLISRKRMLNSTEK
jgi:hypothetical protein